MATKITPGIALQRAGLNRETIIRRLVRAYGNSSEIEKLEGANWYSDALDFAVQLSEATDTEIDRVACVIAAYSPQLFWVTNKRAAATFLQTGLKESGVLGASHDRAIRCMQVSDPHSALIGKKGPKKISAFAQNILGDTEAVTIDTWAVRVALGDREDCEALLARTGMYQALADCYRSAARRIGVAPSTLQAVTWVAIRGRAQ